MLTTTARSVASAIAIENYIPLHPFDIIVHHAGLVPNETHYEKDSQIYGEDGPADYVYQVASGAVRSYKLLSDGRCQITAFHLPGDVFGMDVGAIRRMAADAIVDTTVRRVKRRSLEQAAATDMFVGRSLWNMARRDLEHAEDHLLLLGRKTAVERVAAFLLEMDRRLAVTGMLPLPMCRRDIGDYLGLTLETVSRALSQFHDQGILDFSGARHIVLRNRALLRDMEI
jgi:CRP/FNR family transcriptional regulator, nitrogen fixation regulation protein